MRYLVLSDIHANLEALDAVLADAASSDCDATIVLGDLVGYGADPNAVVDRVRALNPVIVRGNHDKVAAGVESAAGFNVVARIAAEWTAEVLTAENRAYVAALPPGPRAVSDDVLICHGSPFDEDLYVFDEMEAQHSLEVAGRLLCLFGHTHVPIIWTRSAAGLDMTPPGSEARRVLTLDPDVRYLVNPGAVGQPRDGDPRAAYAILEPEARRLVLYRIAYPVEAAQEKILNAGLPAVLARRLAAGR